MLPVSLLSLLPSTTYLPASLLDLSPDLSFPSLSRLFSSLLSLTHPPTPSKPLYSLSFLALPYDLPPSLATTPSSLIASSPSFHLWFTFLDSLAPSPSLPSLSLLPHLIGHCSPLAPPLSPHPDAPAVLAPQARSSSLL